MAESKLYYIPNVQFLVYEGNYELKLENLPMNRFDTLFFKGSTNTLDFSIRDKDRKPIQLLGKTLTIFISNIATNTLVYNDTLEILDYDKGFARLTLTNEDVTEWDLGFYRYSVTVVEESGREGFTFVDQVYNAIGAFELKDGAIPFNSVTSTVTNFNAVFNENGSQYYITGALPYGDGTIHTAAYYVTDFTGDLILQVTLNESVPSQQDDWVDYHTETFDGDTCVHYVNVEGNYTWVRFKYEPNALNTGTVDQILYR